MTDDDRLADYFARLETPEYRRTLPDGCQSCAHSLVYCRMVAWCDTDSRPCCPECSHGPQP